jgi:peptidoglycan/LPS O-acetylase OafA/YrhL
MPILAILATQQKNRIFGLDILRATAILLVLYSHGFDPFLAEHFPWGRSLIFMDGVDLFFVLSGFLIGSILIKQFAKESNYSSNTIISFWKRRWMRTLPNYYFILFLILLVPVIIPWLKGKPLAIPFKTWIDFCFFSQNLIKPQVDFFSEAWSLAVEEWFYLVTPVLLWVYFQILKNTFSKKLIFLSVILSVIIVEFFIRYKIGNTLNGEITEWDSNVRMVVSTRLDSIMYGVLAAFIKFYYPNRWQNKSFFPYLNLLGILCLIFTHYTYLTSINDGAFFFMNTFYFSISGIGVLLLLPQIDAIKNPPRNKSLNFIGKIVTHISLISYSLYLTHGYLILGHLIRYKNQFGNKYLLNLPIIGILMFICYISITIVISTILYYSIEKTFMNMRSKEL